MSSSLIWHEPVSIVTDVDGAITTAGFSFAGVKDDGVQYLHARRSSSRRSSVMIFYAHNLCSS